MTVGYRIAAGTDLDAVFAARVSAAVANVGFKDASGVDLSQRYEGRGGSAPISNTGFLSGSTDLAMIFLAIVAGSTHTMLARTSGSLTGYSDGIAYADIPSDDFVPATMPNGWGVSALLIGPPGPRFVLRHATTTPPNADTTWSTLAITGKFTSDPANNQTFIATRNTSTYSFGTNGSVHFADWQISSSGTYIAGNTYTCVINHS